jgi:hypothetical protein
VRILKGLECCWCSSAAGVGYLALRGADWAVGMFLVRIKAEEDITDSCAPRKQMSSQHQDYSGSD